MTPDTPPPSDPGAWTSQAPSTASTTEIAIPEATRGVRHIRPDSTPTQRGARPRVAWESDPDPSIRGAVDGLIEFTAANNMNLLTRDGAAMAVLRDAPIVPGRAWRGLPFDTDEGWDAYVASLLPGQVVEPRGGVESFSRSYPVALGFSRRLRRNSAMLRCDDLPGIYLEGITFIDGEMEVLTSTRMRVKTLTVDRVNRTMIVDMERAGRSEGFAASSDGGKADRERGISILERAMSGKMSLPTGETYAELYPERIQPLPDWLWEKVKADPPMWLRNAWKDPGKRPDWVQDRINDGERIPQLGDPTPPGSPSQ